MSAIYTLKPTFGKRTEITYYRENNQETVSKIANDRDVGTMLRNQDKLTKLQTLYEYRVPVMRFYDIMNVVAGKSIAEVDGRKTRSKNYNRLTNIAFDFDNNTFNAMGSAPNYTEARKIINNFANAMVCFGKVENGVGQTVDSKCFPTVPTSEIDGKIDNGTIKWGFNDMIFTEHGAESATEDDLVSYSLQGTFHP